MGEFVLSPHFLQNFQPLSWRGSAEGAEQKRRRSHYSLRCYFCYLCTHCSWRYGRNIN